MVVVEDGISECFVILADVDDLSGGELGLEVDIVGCTIGVGHDKIII
jgi:hypothetical protein